MELFEFEFGPLSIIIELKVKLEVLMTSLQEIFLRSFKLF